MAKREQAFSYDDRDALDEQLHGAIADILSAEEQSKHIVAQAQETVKAVQLNGATREREMKETSARIISEARDEAIKDAVERARAEREKRVEAARRNGEKLAESKRETVNTLANELYAAIGGKR